MRTHSHVVDSKAIKTVMAQLPHHWVVRELTERDYGIDLMVEIFAPALKDAKGKDAYAATGSIFHIQIKGTEESLSPVSAGTINYSINKKSLAYVEKFSTPFLLFRVSVTDPQSIYFLWIQRYIKDVMDRETPLWREGEENSITVRIPLENKLPEGMEKIERIAVGPKYLEELAEFSDIYREIEIRVDSIRAGTHDVNDGVIEELRSRAYRVRRMSVLLTHNDCCIDADSVDALIEHISSLGAPEVRSKQLPETHNFGLLAQSIVGMDSVYNFVLENDGLVAY